jgi:hypothetical protein
VTGQRGRVLVGPAAAQARDTLHRHPAGIGCLRSGRHDHRQRAVQFVAPHHRDRLAALGLDRRARDCPVIPPADSGRSRWKWCVPARMGTVSRPFSRAATSRCGTGRASANGASGEASGAVMPWPYPIWPRSATRPCGQTRRRRRTGKRDDRGDQKSSVAGKRHPPYAAYARQARHHHAARQHTCGHRPIAPNRGAEIDPDLYASTGRHHGAPTAQIGGGFAYLPSVPTTLGDQRRAVGEVHQPQRVPAAVHETREP